jgi:hypothetical protein
VFTWFLSVLIIALDYLFDQLTDLFKFIDRSGDIVLRNGIVAIFTIRFLWVFSKHLIKLIFSLVSRFFRIFSETPAERIKRRLARLSFS